MTLLIPAAAHAAGKFSDETLHYVITYKWGLIHKEAGTATLRLAARGNDYRLTLTGRTKPWADKLFQVRDTLYSTVDQSTLFPKRYVKIAHEGGKYSRDDISFTRQGNTVKGAVSKVRTDKKGETSTSTGSLTATGPTFDMLSVFYYLRTLDYKALAAGGTVTASLFSGSKVETLTIRCEGSGTIKLRNGTSHQAYHIKFRFTSGGKKKSSDDIDAWISTAPPHRPLQIFGSLPIGQVRVSLTD